MVPEGSRSDTIAAVATPPGRGGIGVLRISGPQTRALAALLAPPLPRPRQAALRIFRDRDGRTIDQGLTLFFAGPASYTGEDVLELHAHGSPVVLDELLRAALTAGARAARPGEFSERAFLNGRLDLAQAEAVADLIEAGSREAAKAAMASLEGHFSREVRGLCEELMRLRVEAEVLLDFPDEETAADRSKHERGLRDLEARTEALAEAASAGRRLSEGFICVLAGAPNTGKSSLLNALAGSERAIVTEIPGTTRDPVEVDVLLDGVVVRLVDTAGLRASDDLVEAEGVRRALARAAEADLILHLRDDAQAAAPTPCPVQGRSLLVANKIDLSGREPGLFSNEGETAVAVSALTGAGLPTLAAHLVTMARDGASAEGARFSARRRHLDALNRAADALGAAARAVGAELEAEELGTAQRALGEITGNVTTEELLGAIFSTFCIGK